MWHEAEPLNSAGYMTLAFLGPVQVYSSTREQSRLKGTDGRQQGTLRAPHSPLPGPCTVLSHPPHRPRAAVPDGGREGTRGPHTARAGEEGWRRWSSRALLGGLQAGAAAVHNSTQIPHTTENRASPGPSGSTPGTYLKKMKTLIRKDSAPLCSLQHYLQ